MKELIELTIENRGLIINSVFRGMYKMNDPDSEDLYQELCLSMLKRDAAINGGNYHRGYVYRAAMNVALNYIRKERRVSKPLVELNEEIIEGTHDNPFKDPAKIVELRDLLQRIEEDLEQRNPRHVRFLRRFIEGEGYKEIAINEGVPINTVCSRISRARAGIRH